jgi:hypothetical protein
MSGSSYFYYCYIVIFLFLLVLYCKVVRGQRHGDRGCCVWCMETEAAVCGVLCVVLAAVPCGCWQQSRDYLIQSLLELLNPKP